MPGLKRAEVVQGLLALFDQPRYLEIGVARGITFHAVTAAHKVAVDPKFRFNIDEARSADPRAVYHPVTSDEYFGAIADPEIPFDVINLDGLHTVEQTLRDFTNALAFLTPAGVILIDDVVPSSYVASLRDLKRYRMLREALQVQSTEWMGDVYRLVFFIETFCQQISYRTIADNHGQLVAWRKRRPMVPERRIEDIGCLPYEEVVLQKSAFRFASFADIIGELKQRG
ncbi:MAG: hypothetical protein A3G24_03680 [Betaproteobacteria bacterium RIFCSPLOWO2_12_FULL_62_13]|nr:MAG: hypothetical protein A3G24_03680 [Betaproteobacteria bacterium RIFCSPLOWO2_12_FULL_62_13]